VGKSPRAIAHHSILFCLLHGGFILITQVRGKAQSSISPGDIMLGLIGNPKTRQISEAPREWNSGWRLIESGLLVPLGLIGRGVDSAAIVPITLLAGAVVLNLPARSHGKSSQRVYAVLKF